MNGLPPCDAMLHLSRNGARRARGTLADSSLQAKRTRDGDAFRRLRLERIELKAQQPNEQRKNREMQQQRADECPLEQVAGSVLPHG